MRWNDLWIAIVILCSLTCGVLSLRGSELVLAAKTKAAADKLNPTTEVVTVVVGDDGTNTTVVKTKPLLTGIPQIDYIHDPNLPRELKGHNLTNYPFYNAVPKDIEFECDGLHDGFYASVPHQCQVYHHCLFGTRYDFLCANYTAFDQKTFICHFVSEVDCVNSPKYFIRNEALYKQSETTTTTVKPPPTTTTTTTTTVAPPTRKNAGGRRRRPYRRRRPVYEYYYDEDAYDEEYYDDEEEEPPPRKSNRRQQRPSGKKEEHTTTTTTTTTQKPASNDAPLTRAPLSVYVPKVLPKIKRPVPLNEKSKYDYTTRAGTVPAPTSDPKSEDDEEYYDEEYEDPPPPPKKKDTGKSGRRRAHQERKRPSRFDEEYDEEEEEERPRMRKGNRKEDDFRPRSRGSMMKQRKNNRDEEPIPSERPGYISRAGSRKRYEERRRKPEYEYYDDEEEEEAVSRYDDDDRRRPSRVKTQRPKPKKVTTTPTTTTTQRTTTTTTTTTTTPSTTTYKTTKKTTTPAEEEEDEEYEEYDYIEPPKFKPRQEKPTTLAPHRFSTYRTTKVTTTEAPKKTQAVTFRPRNKPDFKRTTAKPEMFSSQVGSPSGFKKQEEPKRTVEIPRRLQTQGLPLEDDSYRRRPQEDEEENIKKDSQLETYRKPYRPETTPPPERTEDFRRPPKYEYFQPTATGPELPRRNQKEEFKGKLENIPPTAPGSINRPFPASAPENPSVQVFRRPYFPSGPERRPSREESEDSRQSDVRTFSLPTGPENYKRPDGMPVTAAGYRRAARPKESKKPDEYYSRKPEEQGPNYRNPFSSRPVKEEPEYFKPKNVEFTAPGPSGESSTQRPLSYNIEEEYDVTLNDALQPSTLNPTLQYTRVKSRGYQSAVTHPSYRSLLLPSASQNYYSKTPLTSDEYEAVVLPAARFTQARYKQRRPNEWYW